MERVIPYADRAAELERVDACVANDLRMLAVQIGLPLAKDAASKKYVAAMLDRLERDKPALASVGAADRAARAQALALDLYRRALGADKPELSPHPRLPWCVTHAPRVAQCFHACAVALDAMRLHVEPLPEQLRKIQAHARSQQLGAMARSTWRRRSCRSRGGRRRRRYQLAADGGRARRAGCPGTDASTSARPEPEPVPEPAPEPEPAAAGACGRASASAGAGRGRRPTTATTRLGGARRSDERTFFVDLVNKVTSWSRPPPQEEVVSVATPAEVVPALAPAATPKRTVPAPEPAVEPEAAPPPAGGASTDVRRSSSSIREQGDVSSGRRPTRRRPRCQYRGARRGAVGMRCRGRTVARGRCAGAKPVLRYYLAAAPLARRPRPPWDKPPPAAARRGGGGAGGRRCGAGRSGARCGRGCSSAAAAAGRARRAPTRPRRTAGGEAQGAASDSGRRRREHGGAQGCGRRLRPHTLVRLN